MGNKRRASVGEDGSEVEVVHKVSKKSKTSAGIVSPAGKDDEGNPFWEISNTRRVGISEFKGVCMISIREYYEKNGKLFHGKKGISMPVDQYAALLKLLPSISGKLREMGQLVDTPDKPGGDTATMVKKSKKEKSDKANIEATSDEDED